MVLTLFKKKRILNLMSYGFLKHHFFPSHSITDKVKRISCWRLFDQEEDNLVWNAAWATIQGLLRYKHISLLSFQRLFFRCYV